MKTTTEYLKGNDLANSFLGILQKLKCVLKNLNLDIAQRITQSERQQTLQAKPFPDISGISCSQSRFVPQRAKPRKPSQDHVQSLTPVIPKFQS